ncbi:MAG: hypothetical protein DRP96_07115 [Candidatus Neomarinimicrobiota bacterium]|nr:MAG: hypothetical protein DRP96_07115 [Candidatus Neomarinimicrobiota bacterium]
MTTLVVLSTLNSMINRDIASLNNLKYFKIFILQIILLPLYLSAAEISVLNENSLLKNWTINDGLPQNTISVIKQTKNGYLWLGSPAGLIRFDGRQFTTFNRQNTPTLNNEAIQCLAEDVQKILWIGTKGGLYSYNQNEWQRYTQQEGLSNSNVRSILADWNNSIWIGTDYGLNRLTNGNIGVFTTDDGLPGNIITDIERDLNGTIWIATLQNGIASRSGNTFRTFGYKEGLHCLEVTDILCDNNGNIWIGTIKGLFVKPINSPMISFISGTEYFPVTSIEKDFQENVWIASMTGEIQKIINFSLDPDWKNPNTTNIPITDLCIDHNNNLWFATELSGIFQIKPKYVNNLLGDIGLPKGMITTVFIDYDSTIWIGSKSKGLYRISHNGHAIAVSDTSSQLMSQTITVITRTANELLWIGTEESGIFLIKQGNIIPFEFNSGLSSPAITAITSDIHNSIWIGTKNGLDRYDQSEIRHISLFDNHSITTIYSDKHRLFIGTENGLFSKGGNDFYQIPSSKIYSITTILPGKDSTYWIGTSGHGLIRFRDNQIQALSTREQFFNDYIFGIIRDFSGNLWFSSYSGIFRYSEQSLAEIFTHQNNRIAPIVFNENEGMVTRQCSNIGQPAATITASGIIYFPTIKGLCTIDSKSSVDNIVSPIIIESINNQKSVVKEPVIVKSRSFQLKFTAVDLAAPNKLYSWYKLEGYDDQFRYIAPEFKRLIQYNDLRPGKYHLTIQVANNSDSHQIRQKTIKIIIPRPFYLNPMIILPIILLLSILVFSGKLIYHRINPHPEKYATSSLSAEKSEEIIPHLLKLMENEKMYLNPNLTIKDLSKHLHIHHNHLSQIINAKFKMNFNDFINRYRINEVKRQLVSTQERNKTILEIMFDSGFNSKSVFNTAFKKITGLTPSEYRRLNS